MHAQKLCVWFGFSAQYRLIPFFFKTAIREENYKDMLEKPAVPQIRRQRKLISTVCQHYGAPPHFSLVARNFISSIFPDNRVISRGFPRNWRPILQISRYSISNFGRLWNRESALIFIPLICKSFAKASKMWSRSLIKRNCADLSWMWHQGFNICWTVIEALSNIFYDFMRYSMVLSFIWYRPILITSTKHIVFNIS